MNQTHTTATSSPAPAGASPSPDETGSHRGSDMADDAVAPPQLLDPASVRRTMARRSFCTLATTSPAGRPHVAGVLYSLVDATLYLSTLRDSRKARNIAANPHVGVVIPVRRLPVGPPSGIQFQGTATLLATDDAEVREHAEAGKLKTITGHGELDLPGGCFVRITPSSRIHTYGLGMSLRRLIADPLAAGGLTTLDR